ncbi:MAG: tRNA preQ1(34) S-adenosylmethionine ribosyltransferase-isomerase QueA [Candidatus Omnitrophica bacterium]|nr:tRNA preQ1(34) S-adenosylmethionine ribosyltransferase-isomerase QueA [Candidatus Omnitrophota bacterium]
MLKLSNFDYGLPKDLIAQYPLEKREEARLMVVERSSGSIKHCSFKDVRAYFKKNDLLVLNDTKVLACRLIGHKATGGKVEILLTKRKSGTTFDSLIQPSRTKVGEKIYFGNEKISGIVTNRREISFKASDADRIYELGQVPLPPYIKREPEELDKEYYQTVYANKEGAIASPTAGLHFTKDLMKSLEAAGVNVAYLTLHVGLGTFKPVTSDNITEHKMEPESFQIPKSTQDKIEEARKNKLRIIAVGTTSLRALEAYAGGVKEGATNLFIYPGYKFKLVNCLLTNFHLPKTTLFMLVCAFGGEELMKKAYQQAVDDKYRFYSYGDAMLII